MKTCTRCGKEKGLSAFQIRKASNDGLTASCKKCLSDYEKTRANLPHRVKARELYSKSKNGLQRILNVYWVMHNFVTEHFTTKQVLAVSLGITKKRLTIDEILNIKMTF